jgi:hypothetical protein
VPNVGEGCSSFKAPAENIVQHETRSAAYKDPLDLTPPSFNLIDESDLSSTNINKAVEGSRCTLDELSDGQLQKLEDDAIKEIESRKRKAMAEPGTASVTPAYQPAPKRPRAVFHVRSPFVDYTTKLSFKCSKEVRAVYAAVCAHARKTEYVFLLIVLLAIFQLLLANFTYLMYLPRNRNTPSFSSFYLPCAPVFFLYHFSDISIAIAFIQFKLSSLSILS